ncbi:carbohydrate ABC transporter permease [Diplocloster agilis]|uniref:Carbohydrate ABC transporter permease n=1 Tax=Diplocloster agilis TaxID=2850323 RepID=A0A949NAC2_9FIRM|nr:MULTISPECIES: carbohydrate ABC transporter permease [Lachnospiraceae]MBU9736322.1 carbohydrate ABC transporter permease [Diplocloster agilis]MCU6736360.1 carbohydrate ABC transporter permease [Suonthocola fibrivorans]SCJ89602.1 Inner membrane ABC transporter permease protein ycjP [uncultured Clostridium sp.]
MEKQLNSRARMKKIICRVLLYGILILFAVICLYPVYFTLVSSLKNNTEIFTNPFSLPADPQFENYARAWKIGKIGIYFRNSIVLTVATLVVTAFVGSLAGYILAKFKFKGKGLIYLLFLAGMMIPIQTVIIPLAFTLGKFGIVDNYPVLILLYSAFCLSMTVFIVTGFMKGLPDELEEAAVMDGAGHAAVFFRIILPLSMPAVASASIFNFVSSWNNLLFPLVFLGNDNLKTISIGLLSFFGAYTSDYGAVMAAIGVSILPPIIMYILLQEKMEKGLTAGAVKG